MKYIGILFFAVGLTSCCWFSHCKKDKPHKSKNLIASELPAPEPIPEPQPPVETMTNDLVEQMMRQPDVVDMSIM
jgi:hypothetical protein